MPGSAESLFAHQSATAATPATPATAAPIEIESAGGIRIDAAVIAEGLGIDPSQLQHEMRAGRVTSLCEQGIDQDSGRYRLTFFSQNRRLRLIIDSTGALLQRLTLHVPGGGMTRRGGRSGASGL